MYIQIDQDLTLRDRDILGYFDLDTASWSSRAKQFLRKSESEGLVTGSGTGIPCSFVVTVGGGVYLTRVGTSTLKGYSKREE